ncbi:MAG: hypothetical protein ABSE48_14445 [Verrucomicrobiota bacterium]
MKKSPVKHVAPFILVCLALIFLTGCFDTKEDFTLNPDGSGKVVIESICSPLQLPMNGNDKQTPEQKTQAALRSILDNVKGVTAWKNVSYEQQQDGRYQFKGIAFFKDINKVVFQNLALINFTLTKRPDGDLVLAAQMGQQQNERTAASPLLTGPELAEKIKEAKGNYQSSRPMMVGFLTPMRQDAIFHLPGAVGEISNFKSTPGGDLRITFAGTNLLAAFDSLSTNDDWWRLHVAGGRNMVQDGIILDNALNEKLFGQKAPVQAVITGSAPIFNYAVEVAAAKTEYAALLKKLGPASMDTGMGMLGTSEVDDSAELAPPAQGGEFKSLKVGGIRWVFDSDGDNNVQSFNGPPGYTLSLIGELPGSVKEFSGGELETATALDGSDLLPEKQWDRTINFPFLSRDHLSVVFEVKLQSPGPDVKGFKEISGNLTYSVGTGSTNVDLGITEIRVGAEGSEFGARISSVRPGLAANGGQNLGIKLQLAPKYVISVKAVGADGQETVLKQNSYSGINGYFTYTFHAKTELPPNARLIVTKYAGIKKYSIPFKLTNLSLLGQPIP